MGEYFNAQHRTHNYDVVICNSEFGHAVNHPRAINVLHGGGGGYARSVEQFVDSVVTERRLGKVPMQRVAAKGKYVVAISNFTKKMVGLDGISVDDVIPLSVDTSVFSPDGYVQISDTYLAASLSNYIEKGFDRLEALASRGLKIRLFGGSGFEAPSLDVRCHIDSSLLSKEYNKTPVFLNPTRFEGAGLTTLEAMASGCPVLTTPTGYGCDMRDVVPDFVVENPDDVEEWLTKIDILSADREKYSKEALDYFWKFHNPDDFKSKWLNLLENLTKNG